MNSTHNIIHKVARLFAIWLVVIIISSAVGLVFLFTGGVSLFNKVTEGEEISSGTVYDNVEKLEIELSASGLEIIQGDVFSVSCDNSLIKVKNRSGKLKISETSIPFVNYKGTNVILSIPYGTVFETVNLETGAGIIKADALNCKKLDIDVGAGEVNVDLLKVSSNADIEVGVGKLTVMNSELNNLSLEVGVGEGSVTGTLTGKSEIEGGIGKLNLKLTGPKDNYTIKAVAGIGKVEIDGERIKGDYSLGSGSDILDITGGIGSVDISFQ